ncbi:hypothetical protein ACPOL_0334 [Acidisarcina polymorpha]|uniref:Uncharacterized protein n=1 Tax=Acidisarcina polymorpha TaxID=2211140 RepID=A0A2Z5FTF3_9BACT|nr:hypothetical protein ACPOL_0334 [Acidisarcina polymorpha]
MFLSVEQLEQTLKAGSVTSDAEMARQLSGMQLTERLSNTKAAALRSGLKGKKSREALAALADRSVFRAPPASDILSDPPAEQHTQELMLSRTVQYVQKTLPKIPDFIADRLTISYEQVQLEPGQTWKTATGDQSLHIVQTAKSTVMFRDGKEVSNGEKVKRSTLEAITLQTVGIFGPILAIALVGATAPQSDITWSYWEKGLRGPDAVFRYHARPQKPLFAVGAESLSEDGKIVPFQMNVPFHGELAIDPQSGAILRLTMQADFQPRMPLDESDVMVEYGPVAIGGNTYVCPLKSVSISRQRHILGLHEWGLDFNVYAPFESLLNDTAFSNYHLFHSTVRMLPEYTPAPN